MERSICVYLEYLTPVHRAQIESAARACGFSVHFFAPPQFEEARAALAGCEVLFAHSPTLLRAAPATLRWYCCAYAGVDPYCRDETIFANPACLLTNSSGAYGVAIAEHILLVTLALSRHLPDYQASIRARCWRGGRSVRSLYGSRVTVLGTGDIGSSFAVRAKALGAARITGLSRSARPGAAGFDEILPISRLRAVLPETEILVMALPGTAQTRGILGAEEIALLPAEALVVNVGRGTAIDQNALLAALNEGRLAGAALDVVSPEPPGADDPVWSAKNLLLTPHVAGDMTLGYTCDKTVEFFCEDLRNYAAGRPLTHLVDRAIGY